MRLFSRASSALIPILWAELSTNMTAFVQPAALEE